jgi:hypothetical protein
VEARVGGLNLHKSCAFDVVGPGIRADAMLHPMKTLWFEGPLLHLPESQQAEDYPRDMDCKLQIAPDAQPGLRYCRLATSQGATSALRFQIGDLPEIIEREIDGEPVPMTVQIPVTINGRIFPRENVDFWEFKATKGQTYSCAVWAARLGSPLDSYLELYDPRGHKLAENDDFFGADSCIRFTAPEDGSYQLRIRDVNFHGGQAYVYRLTITSEPQVDFTYPLGARKGSRVALRLHGANVPADPVELIVPADAPQDWMGSIPFRGKSIGPIQLDLDDLPEHLEAEPNDEPEAVKPVPVPAILNGRIDKPGDVDWWAFAMSKGQMLELELRAARLGSQLEGVLIVLDASGKEIATSETQAGSDPTLRITAAADGVYRVRVSDRFRKRGGSGFGYRLRVAPPPPGDFRLLLSAGDSLTLNRGATAKLRVTADRRGGFSGPIELAFDTLPEGITVSGAAIPAGQTTADVTFKADGDAGIQHKVVVVRGSARIGENTLTRAAVVPSPRGTAPLDSILVAVALPTPFKVVGVFDMRWAWRGSVHSRKYRLERNGFDGPLEVRLADRQARHLQGVTGSTIIVPAGATEFEYTIALPPWMETGRTCRVCVMAVGIIKDKAGVDHEVSFTSLNPNEQLVAVIEPGRLDVELAQPSIRVAPQGSVDVRIKLLRGKGLEGDAKIELVVPEHMKGIHADPEKVQADRADCVLRIHFDKEPIGPVNMPLVVRATIEEGGKPVVAEAFLELISR